MSTEKRARRKIESLRRAGLEYIDKRRLQTASLPAAFSEEPAARPVPVDLLPTSVSEPESMMNQKQRLEALEVLRNEVAGCEKCSILCSTRTQTVFADGSPKAELCFVGEAPGADEDAQGLPFVGRAGQLLTRIIEACKLRREDVYICNVLKCRPPDNRNPTPEEVENCRPYLERQLQLVRPKMMVALGKYAAAHLLCEKPERVPITKLRGSIREYCGIPFMITLHPAYLLRNPNAKRDVWEDMKTVMRHLGKPVE